MKKQTCMDLSTFICPICNNTFPLMRRRSKQRERGHIKDIYCPFCHKVQKFTEVRRRDCFTVNGNVIYM